MPNFFIDRPIFAWVIALLMMLVGGLAIYALPINQYPPIAPPIIQIQSTYPGASAQTVQDTVVQVIEQQLNGLDGLRYITSQSTADGNAQILVTFNQGTNPDIAQVQVQNKLALATPRLPQEVQRQGLRVNKYANNFFLVVGLISTDGSMNNNQLGDFIASRLQDPLSRVSGVGDFVLFASVASMRIWVDPDKLTNYGLTVTDVKDAIRAQNVQVSSGQLGGQPAVKGQQLTATIIGRTRLTTPEEFDKIQLKVNPDGSRVYIKDVARVELAADNDIIYTEYSGKPSAALALRLSTGANALDTYKAVEATIKTLEPSFPEGVKVVYPYETVSVISASIEGVFHTLFEAIILVFLVMYLFLQNLRATLIPALAVPVVLLGTFGILYACGFTINVLTMFAMILAIGLLVDDAIVVVENVERVMREEGLDPKEATRRSMGEIQGALVGIGVVLAAVLLPMAFFGGSVGVIYRQFSITIVSAMALSVMTAMIFTPALCATLLKPVDNEHHHEKRGFFGWFNRTFAAITHGYQGGVQGVLHHKVPFILMYLIITAIMIWAFMKVPTSFLPHEDQKTVFFEVKAPPGSSRYRTQQELDKLRDYMLTKEKDNVAGVLTVNGFSFAGRGQSMGMAFVNLKPWDERTGPGQDDASVVARANRYFANNKGAMILGYAPPAVRELGNATGFDLFLEDQGALGIDALNEALQQTLDEAHKSPVLAAVRFNGMPNEPQYKLIVDDEKAQAYGLTIAQIDDTLSTAWGGNYVNDFIDRGRVKRVYVQGDKTSRMNPEDIDKWYLRNNQGQMVPMSAFVTGKWIYGAPKLTRYNGVQAVEIMGEPAPGYSTGEAMVEMSRIASLLPKGILLAWTGISYEEVLSGSQTQALYAISIVVVFLALAALYESWSIPFAVMLVVPLGVLGTVLAALMRGLGNDVFFQVGLLTTVGLSARNAILIVEFAKQLHEEGMSYFDAAVEAGRMRLRPIVMTSAAFILGVLPLAVSQGAGSGSKHAIGTGVVGGMLSALVLAIFWIPLFYVVVCSFFDRSDRKNGKGEGEKAQ